MTRSALREVVILGGLALQAEDCAIRAALHHRGKHGGLARIENERYHQFIIWRAVLPVWHAEIEKFGLTDLAIDCEDGKHYFELKNWTGASGEGQIHLIQKDVYKLQRWERRYIVVTSLNPPDQTDLNIAFLTQRVVGLANDERQDFRFRTQDVYGKEFEFWIAGWPVLSVERPNAKATAPA